MGEQQPEALRLAELCRSGALINDEWDEVAAELFRLHAVESGAKVELMRRDNLIDSLHGLCESYRTQVESLQAASVEWSPAYTRGPARQSAPVAAVPALVPMIARQLGEWHEDDGYAVWWAWNGETRGWAGEPAYIGSPLCDNWPGYHTHWTLHPKQPECIGLTVGDGAQPIKDTP